MVLKRTLINVMMMTTTESVQRFSHEVNTLGMYDGVRSDDTFHVSHDDNHPFALCSFQTVFTKGSYPSSEIPLYLSFHRVRLDKSWILQSGLHQHLNFVMIKKIRCPQ